MSNKNSELIENQTQEYKLKNDKKMIGIIFLLIILTIEVFSLFKAPYLLCINGYTFGMVLGHYSHFVYAYFIYLSLTYILDVNKKIPKWFKLTKISYWFIVFSIVFIGSSSGYIQTKIDNGWTVIGTKSWQAVQEWFHLFTTSDSAWAPTLTNGGLVGFTFFAFIAMFSSGIGALAFAIILLIFSISLMATGTWIGLYKNRQFRKNKEKGLTDTPSKNIKSPQLPKQEKIEFKEVKTKKEITKEIENPVKKNLPFEDPFA